AVGKGAQRELLQDAPPPGGPTVQLPASVINELLNDEPVNTLADGVRVRRAADAFGASWQEVRFKTSKESEWVWSFGAKWPLGSWRVGDSSGSNGTSESFGTGCSSHRVDTSIGVNHGFTWSFSYGNGVQGSNSAQTFLWAPNNGQGGARPFSEIYIRPTLTNEDLIFDRIPDTGTTKVEHPATPQSNALPNPWGVTGLK